MFRTILKYGVLGSTVVGTGLSLRANDYDLNSVGIVRLGRSAITVYDIARSYKKNLYYKKWDKNSQEYQQTKKKAHKMAAEKLLELCCTNKGVYIKVGQHIGALEYLLPVEYVETMRILHSNAPQNPVEDLYKVIRQDLKKNPEDLFVEFDPEPLGTASLAQVHRAVMKDGTVVAVKVQHSYVMGNSTVDMKTMEVLCKIMAWVFPDFKFQWLIEESKKNLPIELDFLNEGQNAEKVKRLFKDMSWLKVPKIYWDLSTKRVLTMEYVEGGQVNDLKYIKKNKIDPYEVTSKLGLLYSHMIFTHGYVHADPHPGNILLKKNKNGTTDIVLLDHGLYATLSDRFRYEYSKLWLSILRVDRKKMRYHSERLGIKSNLYGLFVCMVTGRPWETVSSGVTKRIQDEREKELLQSGGKLVLPNIADILDTVDRQMLLILKTNDLIRGIETTLGTQQRMTAYWVMSKCCIRSASQEEIENAEQFWKRFAIAFSANWSIIKLNLYYLYRGFLELNFYSTLKLLFA